MGKRAERPPGEIEGRPQGGDEERPQGRELGRSEGGDKDRPLVGSMRAWGRKLEVTGRESPGETWRGMGRETPGGSRGIPVSSRGSRTPIQPHTH